MADNLASCGHPANDDGECNCAYWPEKAPVGRATADHGAAQYVGVYGGTLDVQAGNGGISLTLWLEAGQEDLSVPLHGVPDLIGTLLAGPEDETMTALSARYTQMFTPPPLPCGRCDGEGRVEYDETAPATGPCDECSESGRSGEQGALDDIAFEPLWLVSAFLQRLIDHADYETWDAEACDNLDGMLRELIGQALTLRPRLVPGVPDLPVPQSSLDGQDLLAPYRAEAARLHDARRRSARDGR
jgi:hypothetical protein